MYPVNLFEQLHICNVSLYVTTPIMYSLSLLEEVHFANVRPEQWQIWCILREIAEWLSAYTNVKFLVSKDTILYFVDIEGSKLGKNYMDRLPECVKLCDVTFITWLGGYSALV